MHYFYIMGPLGPILLSRVCILIGLLLLYIGPDCCSYVISLREIIVDYQYNVYLWDHVHQCLGEEFPLMATFYGGRVHRFPACERQDHAPSRYYFIWTWFEEQWKILLELQHVWIQDALWAGLRYVYPPLVYACASLAVQPRRNLYVKQSIACESYWKELDNIIKLQISLTYQPSLIIQKLFKIFLCEIIIITLSLVIQKLFKS